MSIVLRLTNLSFRSRFGQGLLTFAVLLAVVLASGLLHPVFMATPPFDPVFTALAWVHLTFWVATGILAIGQGVLFWVLLELGTVLGMLFAPAGFPTWELCLTLLLLGWLFVQTTPISQRWMMGLCAIAAFCHGGTIPILPTSASVVETMATLIGVLLFQVTISAVAYQVSFWLFWQLGEQAGPKLRWVGWMVCGLGVVCSSTVIWG